MKIGIISDCNVSYLKPYLYPSCQQTTITGDAPAVTNIIEGLVRLNHQIVVFKLVNSKQIEILEGEYLKIVLIPRYNGYPLKYIIGDWLNAYRLRKIIKPHIKEFDCLHAHWNYTNILAVLPWRKKIPTICTIRDWTPYIFSIVTLKDKITWMSKLIIWFYVFSLKNIYFLANSFYTQDRIFHKIKEKVPIIPNPVSNFFLSPERTFYPDKLVLVSVLTSYDKRKNCDTLLKAFQKLLKNDPDATLILIGLPFIPENPKMVQLKKEGMLQNVVLKGYLPRNEIKSIFLTSSILVHPSLEETFGNTLIEAMATKLPVIGGIKSGAVPDVLEHGKSGLLCDMTSPDAILNSIKVLINYPEKKKNMVENAYKRVCSEFSEQAVAQKHATLYSELINSYSRKFEIS